MLYRPIRKEIAIRSLYLSKEYFHFLFKYTECFNHSSLKVKKIQNVITKFFFIGGVHRCLYIENIIKPFLKTYKRQMPLHRYVCHRLLLLRSKYLIKKGSMTLIRNFCIITGRTHSVMRNFSFARATFKFMATQGLLGGVKKGSW